MLCFGRTRAASSMDAAESQQQPTQNRPEAMQPPPEAKLAGYLEKRGRRLPTWKNYWFVLDGPLLLYFRSEEDYKQLSPCKGSINLGLMVMRATDRSEQQRWLQGLLDSINLFSRAAAAQSVANRRYEDASMPPIELSTAEKVRRLGHKPVADAEQMMAVSKKLRQVQPKEKEEALGVNRSAEIAAKLPTNKPVLRMLERQRVAEEGVEEETKEADEEKQKEEKAEETAEAKKPEEKVVVEENGKEEAEVETQPQYTQIRKESAKKKTQDDDNTITEISQEQQKEEPKKEIKEIKKETDTTEPEGEKIEIKDTAVKEEKCPEVIKYEGGYEQINEETSDDGYDQIAKTYKVDTKQPQKSDPKNNKKEEKETPKEAPKIENEGAESEGDYEQIPDSDDQADYEEVENSSSREEYRATPVVIVAEDEVDYAEAEVCQSIDWEGPQQPLRTTKSAELGPGAAREPHCTVISLIEPQVVIIEDDPPPRRPHSADELDAILVQKNSTEGKSPSLEGLFRATPVRLQKAQKAATAWAQDLPDLVPAQREEGDEEVETEEQEDDEEEEEDDDDEDEEEMSINDAIQVIRNAARKQPPRVASNNDGLHQAIAVKVAPVSTLEGPIKGTPVTPLSFALSDIEITVEETVDTMRSPFTSLALD